MKSLRRASRIGAGLIAFCSLASCTDSPSTAGGGDPIVVFGPYRGVEADNFAAALDGFEQTTGHRVDYTGSADFVSDLSRRVESGLDAPDIAVIPQPGVIAELVARDALVALHPDTITAIEANYGPRAAILTQAGPGFVAPYRISPKSLVWYRPDVFERFGWDVPTTIDALAVLADQIESGDADNNPMTPWCFTMAAGTATGWAATDWVEDMVLRLAGPDAYDRWGAGELAWDDDGIREALTAVDELVVTTGRTAGGLRDILQVDVTEASEPMFDEPAGCAMYKQAAFAQSWFPSDVEIGVDVDFFVLPGVDDDEPAPMLIGADSLVQFADDDRVQQLMTYLVSPEGGEAWAGRGGYISARSSVDVDTYYTATDRRFAQLLLDGRTLRFDASDQMPPEVGSGILWSEMTAWVAGTSSLDEFVIAIDNAIASSKEP